MYIEASPVETQSPAHWNQTSCSTAPHPVVTSPSNILPTTFVSLGASKICLY